MNSNETLTLHNSDFDHSLAIDRKTLLSLEADAQNKGIQFYTNPDYFFAFPGGAAAVSLENDGQYFIAIKSVHGEVLMKSEEITGSHQEPTQLWQELHTLELVASRVLTALNEERSLTKAQRKEIESNLEALSEFLDAEAPQDLKTFDQIVQQRLGILECAVAIGYRANSNRRKRFPRLRRMLTKLSKRD